jgi:hypothetical protein
MDHWGSLLVDDDLEFSSDWGHPDVEGIVSVLSGQFEFRVEGDSLAVVVEGLGKELVFLKFVLG